MLGITTFGISLYLFAVICAPADANYVVIDTWGQEYCRPSFCGLMDADGWVKCCERYKKCCAYAEYTNGNILDPFAYNIEKITPRTTTTPTPTQSPEQPIVDLGEPLGELLPGAPGHLRAGHPMASHRLPSLPQIKPVFEETSGYSDPIRKPNKNDVTYQLPPVAHNVQEMRLEEHQREACRSKFCGLMGMDQWNKCCALYKNCCAYISYHSYQDPFYFEKGPNDP